jgi:hypothetical protein
LEETTDKLKNNKAPGPDSINAKLIKSSKPVLINMLHKIHKVWETETILQEWGEGLICPIHKKGGMLECQNYRGITLLNTMYKVFSNILYARLKPNAQKITGSYQCSFGDRKSITDQIQALCQVFERTRECKTDTFHPLIDFKAAYESIRRDKLLSATEEFGTPMKLINLTGVTIKRVKCRLKLQGSLSEPFITQRGLRHGDVLACLLFNITLEKVIRDSGTERRGVIYYKSVQVLAYAVI